MKKIRKNINNAANVNFWINARSAQLNVMTFHLINLWFDLEKIVVRVDQTPHPKDTFDFEKSHFNYHNWLGRPLPNIPSWKKSKSSPLNKGLETLIENA